MRMVYRNLLSDGDINKDDADFIINCIKCDMTTIISRDGRIIF